MKMKHESFDVTYQVYFRRKVLLSYEAVKRALKNYNLSLRYIVNYIVYNIPSQHKQQIPLFKKLLRKFIDSWNLQ